MCGRFLGERGEPAGIGDRVVVEKRQPLARRLPRPCVVACRKAEVASVFQDADRRVAASHESDGVVTRSIVNEQRLKARRAALRRERAKAVVDPQLAVVVEDDDADVGQDALSLNLPARVQV